MTDVRLIDTLKIKFKLSSRTFDGISIGRVERVVEQIVPSRLMRMFRRALKRELGTLAVSEIYIFE